MAAEIASMLAEESRLLAPDELPTVRDLSSDFAYLLAGGTNKKERILMAIEYSDHLRARFQPGVYDSADPEYARRQILSRVYLDTFTVTARRQRFHSLVKYIGYRYSDQELAPLQDLIGAKLNLQRDLAEYISLNPDKDNMAIFGNLSLMMNHTRRILYGDRVTEPKAKIENLHQLSSILAEYKVLSSLQQHWPHATFGSVEQDRLGTDIVIPSTPQATAGVALQVKSSLNSNWDLGIQDTNVLVPIIRIPMDPAQHDPLSLSADHSEVLRDYVSNAHAQALALAA